MLILKQFNRLMLQEIKIEQQVFNFENIKETVMNVSQGMFDFCLT